MPISGKNDTSGLKSITSRNAQSRVALSGSFAQLIVFANGIILTVAIFFILGIFIDKIIAEGVSSMTNEANQNISAQFGVIEKDFSAASTSLLYANSIGGDNASELFTKSFLFKDHFDQVYWLQKDTSGRYISRNLYSEKPQTPNNDPKQATKTLLEHQAIVKALAAEQGEDLKIAIIGQNILIGQMLKMPNNNYDVIYAKTSLEKILNHDFFKNEEVIEKAYVSFSSVPENNYVYSKSESSEGNLDKYTKTNGEAELLGVPVHISLWISPSDKENFLHRILYLSLILGFLFTIIGTLYVHSNKRQSLRLAKMNAELEKNNDRLNKEVQERERLNVSIRKQEKDNRSIIDSVSDIIFEITADGKILFLNETWQKITGFPMDRSLGRNLFDLLYAQDQAEQKSNLSLLVGGQKQSYRAFTRLRTADGTFHSVELAVSMLRKGENKEIRVVGTITDVEDRRRAETALSEAEKKYRAIVENAANGIYQVTPEGQYLSANPAMAKILGFNSPEDILNDVQNASIDIYVNPHEREKQLQDATRNVYSHFETQVRKKDGQTLWVNESLRAVRDESDQIVFFEGNIEDVTLRKQTEIALRDAKVESDLANRAKSEFLANMSHELRTPLNSIIGFSDIIVNESFGPVGKPEYIEYSKDINKGGKRLLQIINEILDVSRIDAGQRQLNEGLIRIDKIVQSCIEMLSPKIEAGKVTISNHIDESTPDLIGENHAIKQMVLNLLSNAVKFTQEGGRITITANLDDEGQMLVSIIDTGVGLTDEEVEIALSPFGQIESSLNRSEAGTGLGLTLVKSLIGLHGGGFELFSQKGIGTTATLTFPVKRVSVKSPKASA